MIIHPRNTFIVHTMFAAGLCLLVASQRTAAQISAVPGPTSPQLGAVFPSRDLVDVNNRTYHPTAFAGHAVNVFLFCGCSWCADVARGWSRYQHATSGAAGMSTSRSVLVFSGLDSNSARALCKSYGLDVSKNNVVADATMAITTQFSNEDCPRAFVYNKSGVLTYTNNHKYDTARKAPGAAIVSCVITAVRSAGAATR